MTKDDLRVKQVWRARADGALRTVIHVAVAGCGDSVAWRNVDGSEGGGSAAEFVATHELTVAKCPACGMVWSRDCATCAAESGR